MGLLAAECQGRRPQCSLVEGRYSSVAVCTWLAGVPLYKSVPARSSLVGCVLGKGSFLCRLGQLEVLQRKSCPNGNRIWRLKPSNQLPSGLGRMDVLKDEEVMRNGMPGSSNCEEERRMGLMSWAAGLMGATILNLPSYHSLIKFKVNCGGIAFPNLVLPNIW